MSDAWVLGSLGASVASLLALVWAALQGFRNGDRGKDAAVHVRLVAVGFPEARQLFAAVAVDNHGDGIVLASARVRPIGRLAHLFSARYSVRTATIHRRELRGVEILGAARQFSTTRWLLPISQTDAFAVRVTVVVDQDRRRTRIVAWTRRLLPAQPIGSAGAGWESTASRPPSRR